MMENLKEYEVEVTLKKRVRVVSQDRVNAENLAKDLYKGIGAVSKQGEPCLMDELGKKGFTVSGSLTKGPDGLKAEMTDPVSGTRIKVEPFFLTANERSGAVGSWCVTIQTIHGAQFSRTIEANRNAIYKILGLWAVEAE